MTTTIGILVFLLVCSLFFVWGIFAWFYPLQTAVCGFKLYVLLNFSDRDRAIQYGEEMLGVQLKDNPTEGYRLYFDAHPEEIVRYKIVALIFWFGTSFMVCNLLYFTFR